MGTSFIGKALDPIGSTISHFAGPNSWFAKMNSNDPLVNSPIGQKMLGANYQLGREYANRNNPADGNWGTPGAYAGQTPTLAAANAGYQAPGNNYVAAARAAASGARGNQVNPYGS